MHLVDVRNMYKSLLYQYGSNHEIKTMQEVKEEKFNKELLNADERETQRHKETLHGTLGLREST